MKVLTYTMILLLAVLEIVVSAALCAGVLALTGWALSALRLAQPSLTLKLAISGAVAGALLALAMLFLVNYGDLGEDEVP